MRWRLEPDGAPIATRAARLLPVRCGDAAAILRIPTGDEGRDGAVLMSWWAGEGAARVLAREGDVLLLERAQGNRSLLHLAQSGCDDEATAILCDVTAALHRPRPQPLPELVPLTVWFRDLRPAAAAEGGLLQRSWAAAEALLADPRDIVPLHGDIHHGNVLDFGSRGWLAIDPNRLIGERGFDYANLFCNPDLDHPFPRIATRPERFARRLAIVAGRSGLERRRLLAWIIAWAGLSAAWLIQDGDSPEVDLKVAALAAAELDR